MVDTLLQNVDLFEGLDAAALHEIGQLAQTRRVNEGGFFFYQEDPAEALYVLQSGRVKMLQTSQEGQQVILRVIGPGTQFGGLALVAGTNYPAAAQAAEDSQALSWQRTILQGLMERYPKLALNGMQMMAGHVEEFQNRFRELATERVERRLARTLLRLARQLGKRTAEGIEIAFPLTRQDLAEMSGTTLYTASRTLSEWERQGLVRTGREKIILLKPHSLVQISEDLPE